MALDKKENIRKIVKYCIRYRLGCPMGSYVLQLCLAGICLLNRCAVVCSFLGYPKGSDVLQFMFIQSIPGEVICLQCVLAWDMSVEVTCCGLQFPGISQGK